MYLLNRILIIVISTTLFFVGLSIAAKNGSNNNISLPVTFDFGSAESRLEDNAFLISASTIYSESIGYGLRISAEEDYDINSKSSLLDHLIYDGISANEAIEFRLDVEPGEYWIELFMHEGEFNIWRGKILLNESLLTDSICAYKTSFEGEDPPPYWTLMKKVSTSSSHMVLKIFAEGQPSTLAGLHVYKHCQGLLNLNSGKIEFSRSLKSPNALLAIRLINAGEIFEAQRVIDPIPEKTYAFEKASLLMALAGRLEIDNPRPFLEWAASLFRRDSDQENRSEIQLNLRFIELFLEGDQWYKMAGWDWAKDLTGQGIFTRLDMAGLAYQKIADADQNPLSLQSHYQLGKIGFWGWVEQHDPTLRKIAKKSFSVILPYYPDHKLLKMYYGESFPSTEFGNVNSTKVPDWAYYTTEALNSILEIIHYWVDKRQADNGEFGGKFDDDVEMLRWWPVARMASNDSITLVGLERLVNGVWNSGWVEKGFSKVVRDVEHAAEPIADTQPMMIGLDYGNPVYVERCMIGLQSLMDLWTGVNDNGHRHFKSSWYSATEIDTTPPKDCDVAMNTRTIKAARWLAWYNRHPVAMQFLREWGDAWLEDCLREDKGKPRGVVPSAIRYHDDAIGGHADNWHHPGLFWSYYNFHGGTDMLQQFLATFDLTGDKKYLSPINLAINIVKKYSGKNTSEALPGSEAWVANIMKNSVNFVELIETWRLLTGENEHDDYLKENGSDYLKFMLNGDIQSIEKGNKHILEGIRKNQVLLTKEGYFTDRIDIGDIHKQQVWGASHLESVFTGSSLNSGFYPYYSVTWDGFGNNFAALVLDSTPESIKVYVYSFEEKPISGKMLLWRLNPGNYTVSQGLDKDGDFQIDETITQKETSLISKPSQLTINIPPQQVHLISLDLISAIHVKTDESLADLALTKSDIKLIREENDSGFTLRIPVHNIGILDAVDFDLEVEIVNGETIKKELVTIAEIKAPLDLSPKIILMDIPLGEIKEYNGRITISLDPDNRIDEITEKNNRLRITWNSLLN